MLCLLLALWWAVPIGVKSFLQVTFSEFQAPVWLAQSFFGDLQNFWARRSHSKRELIEAGRELARGRAAAELNQHQDNILRAEIDRLNALLDLDSHAGYDYAVARVVRRDIHTWWQQITIGKGRNAGIAVGAPVVFGGGIVGQVTQVMAYTAIVELISSPQFRMIAQFLDDDRPVTYQGRITPPLTPPGGKAYRVQPEIRVTPAAPRQLISSGLGGIFPPGLSIGLVEALSPADDGLDCPDSDSAASKF